MSGYQYWPDCPKKHGVFVPPKKVTKADPAAATTPKKQSKKGGAGGSPKRKMGEQKLVKVLKDYYKKVVKNPDAKTDEQLVALAQRIRASDKYTDLINGPIQGVPMEKKCGYGKHDWWIGGTHLEHRGEPRVRRDQPIVSKDLVKVLP